MMLIDYLNKILIWKI